jgi:Protein of unknown function (DUF4232)
MRFAWMALLPVTGLALAACTAATPAAPTVPTVHTRVATVTRTPASPVQPSKSPPPACQPQVMTAGPGVKSTVGGAFSVTAVVTNTGTLTCSIEGYPTVAITGLPPATGDWPRRQLTVVKDGPAEMVVLAPGDGAAVTLTFTPCQAGEEAATPPVVLLGVPTGGIVLTLQGGDNFVECGDVVKATAFKTHQG